MTAKRFGSALVRLTALDFFTEQSPSRSRAAASVS